MILLSNYFVVELLWLISLPYFAEKYQMFPQ